jgi:glycosyltransferase involved in cell wall biosynthesis
VLLAAARLRDDSSIHFLFVGEGAEKDKLRQLAAELRLDNVTFLKEQPRERLVDFYRASDVSLVPLRRLEIFRKVLPSKLFELMGSGSPIICSVEGEAAALVERAGAGVCIEPENAEALVTAIRRLRAEPELRAAFSRSGARFVRTHYLRSVLAEKYRAALQQVISGQQSLADHPLIEEPEVRKAQASHAAGN